MKLKQTPADFQVEELSDVQSGERGDFALYRLEKQGLGTPEAVQAVCRRWKLQFRQVSYGGLKDRHAQTTQFITIWHGPRRGLKQQHLHLQYLGQLDQAFTPEHVRGNRFEVALRDLSAVDVERAQAALAEVQLDGVANYFDDQRFGSVGRNRAFVAQKLIAGDYEKAVRLALVEPYEFDTAQQKEEKTALEKDWGKWSALKAKLPRGQAQRIATFLAGRPTDFRGAFALLPADLKSLYLAAYQSHVWNRMLARWLKQQCRSNQLITIDLRLGDFPMFRGLDAEQRAMLHSQTLPLPSARLHLAPGDPLLKLIERVLKNDRLELRDLKLKHFREPFFAKGDRAVCFVPQPLRWQSAPDELNTRRQKLVLSFELPRGCYATMLVKRVTVRG